MYFYRGPVAYLSPHENVRSIVVIKPVSEGTSQAFYRSTGNNSGMPGVWFPFDGITILNRGKWFSKGRFIKFFNDPEKHLHRFGTQENKEISNWLSLQQIPEGNLLSAVEINNFIDNAWSKVYNESLSKYEKENVI